MGTAAALKGRRGEKRKEGRDGSVAAAKRERERETDRESGMSEEQRSPKVEEREETRERTGWVNNLCSS